MRQRPIRTATELVGRAPTRLRTLSTAGVVLAVGAIAAACGSGSAATTSTTAVRGRTVSGSVLLATTHLGSLGTVLVDQNGFTLYRFADDGPDHPTCVGPCASLWPPLVVPSGERVKAGTGVTASLVGTTVRPDGTRQVVYAGVPLYLYKADTKAGQANGQGLGGVWFAASSTPAAAPPTTTSTTAPPTSATNATTTTAPPATTQPTAPPVTAASPPPPAPTTTTAPPPTTTTTTSGGGGYGY